MCVFILCSLCYHNVNLVKHRNYCHIRGICISFATLDTFSVCFLNFMYFTTITKRVKHLILIMLVGTDVRVSVVFVWEETGVPEETHLSGLVTTCPSHMPMPGIEPGPQR